MHYTFILVEPGEQGNIGAAARALQTMGHHTLRLVRPQADHLHSHTKARAHLSTHLLDHATVHESLEDAVKDLDFTCACTDRHRQQKHTYFSARELPELLASKQPAIKNVGIIFGSERSGLSRDDLEHCDLLTTIPQATVHPSLNLAQAVMLYSFLLAENQTSVQIADQRLNSQKMPPEQYQLLKKRTLALMDRLGLPEGHRKHLAKALALLRYEDLNLIQTIRSRIEQALTKKDS